MKLAYILFAALCFVGNMSAADGNAVSKQDLQDIFNVYAKAVTEKIKPGDLLQGKMADFSLDSSASESRISVTQGALLCLGVGFGGRNGGSDELLSKHGRITLLEKPIFKLPDEDFDKEGVCTKEFVDSRTAFDKELIQKLGLTNSVGETPKMLCATSVAVYNITTINGKKMPKVEYDLQKKDTNEHKSSKSSEK